MDPCYFGPAGRRLFGVHHPPAGESTSRLGVVACYPMGQEYIRAHRCFRHLAERLAAQGIPTLRFDYFGCGDSQGAEDAGHPSAWVADIDAAIEELKEESAVEQLCLAGLRLGATLALLAAARRDDVRSLVLWQPMSDGKSHLKELARQHQEWLQQSSARTREAGGDQEVLGFRLTPKMVQDLEGIDLKLLARRPAGQALVLESGGGEDPEALLSRLRSLGVETEFRRFPPAPIWIKARDGFSAGLVPAELLQEAVQWISRTAP